MIFMADEKNKEDYTKKIKLCKRLGAERFQKIVFAVEKIKFKVIKKCFPNYLKNYEAYCDKRCKKDLKKARNEKEREAIITHYREQKLLNRKEINTEKNRNYHLDNIRPTDTMRYLEWNKKIHQKALIRDIVLLPVFTGLALTGLEVFIPLIIGNLLSSYINFHCVNLQNYNICRFKKHEATLNKMEKRKVAQRKESFSEAAEVIDQAVKETSKTTPEIPSIDEVIARVENKEQLIQFKNMIMQAQKERGTQQKYQKSKGEIKW